MASFSVMSLLMLLAVSVTVSSAARNVQNDAFGDVKVDINKVCAITENPGFCNGVLRAVPGIQAANLFDLADHLLNEGLRKATDNLNLIKLNILPKATDAQKVHLEYCGRRYEEAISGFRTVSQLIGSRDFVGLNKQSSKIQLIGKDCENSFRSAPAAPSPITQNNNDFFNTVDILTATSYRLSHP